MNSNFSFKEALEAISARASAHAIGKLADGRVGRVGVGRLAGARPIFLGGRASRDRAVLGNAQVHPQFAIFSTEKFFDPDLAIDADARLLRQHIRGFGRQSQTFLDLCFPLIEQKVFRAARAPQSLLAVRAVKFLNLISSTSLARHLLATFFDVFTLLG